MPFLFLCLVIISKSKEILGPASAALSGHKDTFKVAIPALVA
jgi:hypothetical protein